jgi:hypothetical protein
LPETGFDQYLALVSPRQNGVSARRSRPTELGPPLWSADSRSKVGEASPLCTLSNPRKPRRFAYAVARLQALQRLSQRLWSRSLSRPHRNIVASAQKLVKLRPWPTRGIPFGVGVWNSGFAGLGRTTHGAHQLLSTHLNPFCPWCPVPEIGIAFVAIKMGHRQGARRAHI